MFVPVSYTVHFQILIPYELVTIGKYGTPIRLPISFSMPCFFVKFQRNAEDKPNTPSSFWLHFSFIHYNKKILNYHYQDYKI